MSSRDEFLQIKEKYKKASGRLLHLHQISVRLSSVSDPKSALVEFCKNLASYPIEQNTVLGFAYEMAMALCKVFAAAQVYAEKCADLDEDHREESKRFATAQRMFVIKKQAYCEQSSRCIMDSSFDVLISVLKELNYSLIQERDRIKKIHGDLQSKALLLAQSAKMSRVLDDEVHINSDFPIQIPICGGKPVDISAESMFSTDSLEESKELIRGDDICVDMKRGGNIMINAPVSCAGDSQLYDFICNIVLQYYDRFPLGALHVHFLDQRDDPLFSKFINGLQKGGDRNVRVRQVAERTDFKTVIENLKARLDDMRAKFAGNIHDVYDLFHVDPEEYFDLIVIRSGLSELAGRGYGNEIGTIANWMENNANGHRCGIRFLVVNDIDEGDLRLDENVRRNICTMKANSDVIFDYHNGKLLYNNNLVRPVQIDGKYQSEEDFIEAKCCNIGKAIKEMVAATITYEELGGLDKKPALQNDPVIRIPVGKSGSKVVTIPFSCADEENSSAGKNIGLMVLGQSGAGKSSLYHSILINGALRYTPEDLEFWLLDFKSNASAGIYASTDRNIPHIRMVAPNSRINDAYNILGLLIDELEYRNDTFNALGEDIGKKFSNVAEYNAYLREQHEKVCDGEFHTFPRIVLLIDEAQEMFRGSDDGSLDDLPNTLATRISTLVNKGRSAGIHMAMFAQNLDSGKTFLLESFIKQLQCKVCFRLSQSSVTNSGFHGGFDERKAEIEKLDTGEIYLSYSSDELVKCRVAYAGGNQLLTYLQTVIDLYPDVLPKVLKIGVTARLRYRDRVANSLDRYLDRVLSPENRKGKVSCTIGENAYMLDPIRITFDSVRNSGVFLCGSSRGVSTSLLSSILIGVSRTDALIYMCRGMPGEESFYNRLSDRMESDKRIRRYRLAEIDVCIAEVYRQYLQRKKDYDEKETFDTKKIFLFLSDFDGQGKLKENKSLFESDKNDVKNFFPMAGMTSEDFFAQESMTCETEKLPQIYLKDAIGELLDQGWKYCIYPVVTLKSEWYREFDEAIRHSVNVIVFNDADYAGVTDSYAVRAILRDMRQRPARNLKGGNDFDDRESFALLRPSNGGAKFRPVIYNEDEIEELLCTIEEKNK